MDSDQQHEHQSSQINPNQPLPQPLSPPPSAPSQFEIQTQHQIHQLTETVSELTSLIMSLRIKNESASSSSSSSSSSIPSHSSVGIQRNLTPHSNQIPPPLSPGDTPIPIRNHINSNSKLYNGLVKFNPPSLFSAKPDESSMILINFISSMDRYLGAIQVDPNSNESLHVSANRLDGYASQWYDYTNLKEPHRLISWNTLKEAMKIRYQPKAQGQLALSSLLKVRYTNSIEKLNHEFLKYLQLLPEYNNGQSEHLLMGIYLNALTEASGTTYICTTLKNYISRDEVKTLSELQSQALLAESNLAGKQSKSNVPVYVHPHTRFQNSSSSSSSSSHHHRFSNQNLRPSPSHNKSGYNRPSVPAPSFSTPIKLHNVQVENDSDDYDNQSYQSALAYENEINHIDDQDNQISNHPHFHNDTTDSTSSSSSSTPSTSIPVTEDEIYLNALRMYDKAKHHSPGLSADEIDRRRRTGTCFKCNRPGHFANNCTAPSSSSSFPKKF